MMKSNGRHLLAALALLSVAAIAPAADFYVATTGNDTTGDGTLGNPYATLTRALTEAAANGVGSDTINMGAGTFSTAGTITISTTVVIQGVPGTIITSSGTGTTKDTQRPVLCVETTNVTIQDVEVHVNRPGYDAGIMLRSVGATAVNPTGALVQRCVVRSFGSGGSNAVGIFYRNSNGTNRAVTVRANQIKANDDVSPTSVFARGIWTFQAMGTFGGPAPADGNTVLGAAQDFLCQFTNNALTISNNTFLGAGIDVTEPNGGAQTLTISNNNFTPLSPLAPQSLLLKHNNGNRPILVENNVFNGHGNVGIWCGAWRNCTVRNNVFTPAAGDTDFVHVRVDSAVPGTNIWVGAFDLGTTFTGNTFNEGTVAGGTGILFKHGRKANALVSNPANSPYMTGFFFGGAGADANTFQDGLTNYISVDGTTVNSEYSDNFDLQQNLFEVGGVAKRPADMSYPELAELHGKFVDTFDSGNLAAGYGRVLANEIFLLSGMNINRAATLSASGDLVSLDEGTYNAAVGVTKNLTIEGIGKGAATILAGSGSGIAVTVGTGFAATLRNFSIANWGTGVSMDPTGASLTASKMSFDDLGTAILSRAGSTVNVSESEFGNGNAQVYEPQGAPAAVTFAGNLFHSSDVYFAQAFYGAPFAAVTPASFQHNWYGDQWNTDQEGGALSGNGLDDNGNDITVNLSAQSIVEAAPVAQFDGDADGLPDAFEPLAAYGSALNNRDTDGDNVTDGYERALGTSPSNNAEVPGGFNLTLDTDGDGFVDWYEIALGNDEADANDAPALGNVDPSAPEVNLGDAVRALQIINGTVAPFTSGANPHAINVTGSATPNSLNNPLQILRFQNGSRASFPAIPGIS